MIEKNDKTHSRVSKNERRFSSIIYYKSEYFVITISYTLTAGKEDEESEKVYLKIQNSLEKQIWLFYFV